MMAGGWVKYKPQTRHSPHPRGPTNALNLLHATPPPPPPHLFFPKAHPEQKHSDPNPQAGVVGKQTTATQQQQSIFNRGHIHFYSLFSPDHRPRFLWRGSVGDQKILLFHSLYPLAAYNNTLVT